MWSARRSSSLSALCRGSQDDQLLVPGGWLRDDGNGHMYMFLVQRWSVHPSSSFSLFLSQSYMMNDELIPRIEIPTAKTNR